MSYADRYAQACRQAFEGFVPDFSGCRNQQEAHTILELAQNGKISAEIAEAIGKTPKAVQKFFRRYNFPSLHNVCPREEHEQPMWKGGVKIVKGYAYQRTKDHPYKSKHGGYVAVHRLVMEQKIGRFLLPEEVVDHIDGNTMNNHPDNLRVFENNAEHLRVTLAGRCPQWSEEGRKRISDAVRQRHAQARVRKASANQMR
jgi:hypothetical protein